MAKLSKRPDGRYQMAIYLGHGANGKRRYKTVYGATQKEVKAKADEIRMKLGKGIDIQAQRDSFAAWRDRWLATRTCNAGQLASYKSCSAHLVEELGDMELCKVRTADIQAVITALGAGPKALGRKTLGQIRMAARQIFALAVINRVIDYNPADAVTLPKNAPAPEMRAALTDEQMRWIRETPESRAYLPAMIMLYCGLRRGEIMALRWADIDLEARRIHVRRSVEMARGRPVEKDGGKSDSATRDVPIPEVLLSVLSARQPTAEQRKKVLHPRITERTTGELHTDKSWTRLWASFMEDINIKHGDFSACAMDYAPASKHDPRGVPCVIDTFTPHQLRHTYATLLYEAGVDVLTAQKLLGHAKPETTLNIYTHLRAQHERIEISKLDSYLGGDASQMQVRQA